MNDICGAINGPLHGRRIEQVSIDQLNLPKMLTKGQSEGIDLLWIVLVSYRAAHAICSILEQCQSHMRPNIA